MFRPIVIRTVLPAVAAGALGFFLGSSNPAPPDNPKNATRFQSTPSPAASAPSSSQSKAPATVAEAPRNPDNAVRNVPPELLAALGKRPDSDALWRIIGDWLKTNPDEAVAFLSGGDKRDELLQNTFRKWAEGDVESASRWLSAHGSAPGRDAMAAGLASGCAKGDPQAAMQWAASIHDPALKLAAGGTAGYEFYRTSDEEAAKALTTCGLPPSAFEALRAEWQRRLTATSSRNAQNVASTFNAARAAGSETQAETVESVIQLLNAGIKGGGQFRSSTFSVDLSQLTEREMAITKSRLEIVDGAVSYTGQ
ncbi:MAG TPA: hypothetical protein VG796_02445 [Verrucomicrobiales bacterium]|nr:hypothetical protein [Verrucomicrobiales bacterium]